MTTTSVLLRPSTPEITRRVTDLYLRLPRVIRFGSISLFTWVVDYVLVLALNSLTGSVLLAVVGARLASCTLNFLINRRLFHAAPETFWSSAAGYTAVQGTVMMTSYLGIAALTAAGGPLWLVKIVVDSSLFLLNYMLQSRMVYGDISVVVAGRTDFGASY